MAEQDTSTIVAHPEPRHFHTCKAHEWLYYGNSVACFECRKGIKAWLRYVVKNLDLNFKDAEVVVFSGSSGACVGYFLADLLGLPTVQIQKPGETSHGSESVGHLPNGYNEPTDYKRWILIDDFVDSGTTVRRISAIVGSKPTIALFWKTSHWHGSESLAETIVHRTYEDYNAGSRDITTFVHKSAALSP
jgi:hypoxanthine phosphoribosyltransferase